MQRRVFLWHVHISLLNCPPGQSGTASSKPAEKHVQISPELQSRAREHLPSVYVTPGIIAAQRSVACPDANKLGYRITLIGTRIHCSLQRHPITRPNFMISLFISVTFWLLLSLLGRDALHVLRPGCSGASHHFRGGLMYQLSMPCD